MRDLPDAQAAVIPAPSSGSTFPVVGITAIDWVTKGKVGPVKNQGYCGSCWAFSTVGTIESNVAIKRKTTPKSYSEQQLVDCCGVKGYYCSGCNGAWPRNAMNYVGAAGLANTAAYNYVAKVQACRDDLVKKSYYLKAPTATVPSYTTIAKSVASLATKLLAGPVSVCVYASQWSSYASGIFSGCAAGQTSVNHAVVLVGVDSAGNWRIKNSWSTGWGESGYMRLSGTNDCGILGYAVFPVLL